MELMEKYHSSYLRGCKTDVEREGDETAKRVRQRERER